MTHEKTTDLDLSLLSPREIRLLHMRLGAMVVKLRQHEPASIKDLREKGYEIEVQEVEDPISRHLDPI